MTTEQVKQLRIDLSMLLNTLKAQKPSRYLSLAITSIEVGRMHLGDVLAFLQEEYPYNKENYNPVDVSDEQYEFNNSAMRKGIGQLIDLLVLWYVSLPGNGTPDQRFKVKMALRNAYTGLREGKLWLGMELAEKLKNETTSLPLA